LDRYDFAVMVASFFLTMSVYIILSQEPEVELWCEGFDEPFVITATLGD
jgi:hypothetical protein